jgi:hypothetical protein
MEAMVATEHTDTAKMVVMAARAEIAFLRAEQVVEEGTLIKKNKVI